jgi:hypothetical protein
MGLRLTLGDDEPHRANRHGDQNLPRVHQHVLVGEGAQRDHGGGQQQHRNSQRRRGPRFPQPDGTPGSFRERYRAAVSGPGPRLLTTHQGNVGRRRLPAA